MSTSTILDRIRILLKTTPPFDLFSDEVREELLKDVSIEYFGPGEVIIAQGQAVTKGLYLMESGLVVLRDVDQQRLLDKCAERETFGSFSLVKGGGSIYEAKAVEPTVCALLKGESFQALYKNHPDFSAYYDGDLKQYIRRLGTNLDVVGAHLLFSRRLSQLKHRQPLVCPVGTSVQEVAQMMQRERRTALLVMDGETLAGIVTNTDLAQRVVAPGLLPTAPVQQVMNTPVITISSEANLFDAMTTMLVWRVPRLVITHGESAGVPIGIITDRELAHFRGQDPLATVNRIEHTSSTAELSSMRSEISEELLYFYRQGVQPEQLTTILSYVYDRISKHVLLLVERELAREVEPVKVPWVWLRLGSGGRNETALSSEQFNALLYAGPSSEKEARKAERWFQQLAARADEVLESCGFPNGPTVDGEPSRCLSLRAWKKVYRTWIFETERSALAPLRFYFDLRMLSGDADLMEQFRLDIEDALNVQAMDLKRRFIPVMAANALENRPPISLFRRFVLQRSGEHRNTFNIKDHGIIPIVDAARVLALELRYFESAQTFDRLRYAARTLPELEEVIKEALDAYQYLFDFRLENQLRSVEAGEEPDNYISPFDLTKIQQNMLRSAFSAVDSLQNALSKRYELDTKRGL